MKRKRSTSIQVVVALVVIAALLLEHLPIHAEPLPQGRRDLVACTTVDEAHLLDDLNTVTQTVFADSLARIDLVSVVQRQWQALDMDKTLQRAVDEAITQVQNDTDLWATFLSGWSTDKAQQLTLAVANAAFAAPSFRAAMNQLSSAIAADIASQIGELSAESVSAGLYCLQTFIKGNYSQALLASFDEKVQSVAASSNVNTAELAPSLLQVIGQHSTALGGVGVIIAAHITRRIVTDIAARISQRVAGRIAGRVLGRIGSTVIPLAGWIVGVGLIAYDIYDSLDGALPQIQESLKSPDVAAAIRAEIADSIEPELKLDLPAIARQIANDLHSQWLTVKRDIRVVLELAADSDAFADILQRTESRSDLAQLVAIVGAALPSLGRSGVIAAAESGALARLTALPADPSPIIAATGSLESAAAWGDVAGALLGDVITMELYKHLSPAEVDRWLLQRLLALGNRTVIERLALLPVDQIRTLLTVSPANLAALTSSLSPEQMRWLADTLAALDQAQRNALIAHLISEPQTLTLIQQVDLHRLLAAHEDLAAAIAFLNGPRDIMGLFNDTTALISGGASLRLFSIKYGWGVTALVGLAFVLLVLVMLRLIYGLAAWLFAPLTALRRGGR